VELHTLMLLMLYDFFWTSFWLIESCIILAPIIYVVSPNTVVELPCTIFIDVMFFIVVCLSVRMRWLVLRWWRTRLGHQYRPSSPCCRVLSRIASRRKYCWLSQVLPSHRKSPPPCGKSWKCHK